MIQKTITLQDKSFQFINNYKDNSVYRGQFNQLTQKTYGFDLEQWYQDGFWQSNYNPYSIFYKDKIISNISVNFMQFIIQGKKMTALQLGTVMTDLEFRSQGFSRLLMEEILTEFKGTQDFIYLFANDTVLNFYPKFGFVNHTEYSSTKLMQKNESPYIPRKLDMDQPKDRTLILDLIKNRHPYAKISVTDSSSLIMFYCTGFLKDAIYYYEGLDTAVIAEYQEEELFVHDIFSKEPQALDLLIQPLVHGNSMTVTLGFTPIDGSSYITEKITDPDTVLFVLEDTKKPALTFNDIMFPTLSHA